MHQTHVENLSQSDKTNISNALFNMDTKLGVCQSSHVLPSLAFFEVLLEVHFFQFFELEVEMNFYACTPDGYQPRSIRFEATPFFFEEFNARSAGGSVVEPVEARRPIVSDHHINVLPFHVFLA